MVGWHPFGVRAMTPADLTAARVALGLTKEQLAQALRLRGRGLRSVQRWEAPGGEVPGPVQVAVEMMLAAKRREAAADRDQIVAYLRSESSASSCRLAMLHVADQIERGAHATAPDPRSAPG